MIDAKRLRRRGQRAGARHGQHETQVVPVVHCTRIMPDVLATTQVSLAELQVDLHNSRP